MVWFHLRLIYLLNSFSIPVSFLLFVNENLRNITRAVRTISHFKQELGKTSNHVFEIDTKKKSLVLEFFSNFGHNSVNF